MKTSGTAIQVEGLSKRYGDVQALDRVDLDVRRGEIYGFLGLNGAGKTTTIRLILGMVRPTAGSVRVLGQAVEAGASELWRKVGYLVESPTAYGELTVRENLELSRRLGQVDEAGAVERMIGALGLGAYAGRRARTLSLWNLQRLGLAKALIGRPQVLLLDEPANGLDPAGVVEVRALLRALSRKEGTTVLMSSHILTEVEALADRIGIIHKGRMVEELGRAQLGALRQRRLSVDATDRGKARRALVKAGYTVLATPKGLLLSDPRAVRRPHEVARTIVRAGALPSRLAVVQEDLESHFLRLTADAERRP